MRVWAIAIVVMLCAGRPAAAQSAAEAEALFREGKRLIKAGKLAEGCAKLEASERLESSTGTQLNLGSCRETNGQLASAWAAFVKAAASARRTNDPKREAEATRRAKSLEARLGHLTISIAHRVDGLQIERDDQTVDAEQWNTDVPLDADVYRIRATAPGRKPWASTVTVTNGAKATIEVPILAPEPVAVPVATPPDAQPEPEEPHEAPRPGTFTTTRKIAIVVGAAGVVGVAVGAIFGVKSRDLQRQANAICPQAACSDSHAVSLDQSAQTDAKGANLGFVIGGAAAATGVVLWLLGGPTIARDSISLAPASHGTGLAITGSF